MTRKPSPERQAEYEEIKRFLLTLTEFLDSRRLPLLTQGIEAVEAHGFSSAFRGTRMAVNDTLEETIDLDQDTLRQADEFLSQRGCKTLTSMRHQVRQTIPKILRRGRIRNDEEYYLIIERLNDMTETGFQGSDREKADSMVLEYEHHLHRALKLKAVETSRSVSDLVNDAVRESLAEDADDLEAFADRVAEPLVTYEAMVKRLKRDGLI